MLKMLLRLKDNAFIRNNFIFLIGSLTVGVLNYLYYPVLGHFMNGEDFGELQTVVSLFMQFSIFLAALSLITVNLITNQPDNTAKNLAIYELEKLALFVTFGALVIIVILSPFLKVFLQFSSLLPFLALAVSFVITVPFTFRNAYLRGKLDFFGSSMGNMIGATAKILFSGLLVYIGLRTFGAVVGIIIAQIIAYLYTAGQAKRKGFSMPEIRKFWRPPNLVELKPHLKYGAFVFTVSLIIILQLSLDILVIKHYFAPSEAGQYAGIAAMARIIFFLTASVAMVLFSSVRITQSRAENRQLLVRSLGLMLFIGGMTLLVFTIAPRFVLGLLFPKYITHYLLLPSLSLTVFIISIANLLFSYYMALRQYWITLAAIGGALMTYSFILINHDSMQEVINGLLYGTTIMVALLTMGAAGLRIREGREI